MAHTTRNKIKYLVQTSTDFATWTTVDDLRVTNGPSWRLNGWGTASLQRFFGPAVQQAGGTVAAVSPLTTEIARGKFIRIMDEDLSGLTVGGQVTVGGTVYNSYWEGKIDQVVREVWGGAGSDAVGLQRVECSGLASMLEQLYCNRGWERWAALPAGRLPDPGYLPAFNRAAQGKDKNSAYLTINGVSSPVHNRSNDAAGGFAFSAGEILTQLLAGFGKPQMPPTFGASGIDWQLNDPQLCLLYIPRNVDFNGRSVLSAIQDLCGGARGICWWVYYDFNVAKATVIVRPSTGVAITVGTYALPANSSTFTLDATTDPFIQDVRLIEDAGAQYDLIEAVGDRPWSTMSFEMDQTTGLGTGSALLGGAVKTQASWQYLAFNPAWENNQYNSVVEGIRVLRTISYAAAYGAGGYDGTRDYNNSPDYRVLPAHLELTADLPAAPNNGLLTSLAGIGTRAKVFQGTPKSGGGYIWEDRSNTLAIQVVPASATRSAGVWIGDHDAVGSDESAKHLLNGTGVKLVFTLAVREPAPLSVSWSRDPVDWPCITPRTLRVEMPQYQQHLSLKGTVYGAFGAGLSVTATDQYVRDDLPSLRATLALLVAFYGSTCREMTWRECGILRTVHQLGDLLATAVVDTGSLAIGSVVAEMVADMDTQCVIFRTAIMQPDVPNLVLSERRKTFKERLESDRL